MNINQLILKQRRYFKTLQMHKYGFSVKQLILLYKIIKNNR